MVIAFFVCMGDGLTWGSGCSGSDSPMWAFAAIAAAIAELSEGDCVLEFQHLFSAEMSPRKRQGDSTILAAHLAPYRFQGIISSSSSNNNYFYY
jgi:hypothetical protein